MVLWAQLIDVKGEGPIAKFTRLNDQIRANRLRVIDEDGKQLGVLSRQEALEAAREQDLDLVEISPEADPPVCKIIDWGKYNYQRTKQQQKNRKTSKSLDMKQMRFGLKISDHDLGIKMNKVSKFLEAGHKVKITIFYRGREQAHKEIGFQKAQKVIEDFGDTIIVDQQPQLAGRQLNFVVRHNPRSKSNAKTEDT
ncbi:MAG TPA: translation initiation factor IF-3 [Candidatus Saccharimonadales bacterium]|nr:translation initiation factor IF-3 [Candidatus Saccharimonadales bacterium]